MAHGVAALRQPLAALESAVAAAVQGATGIDKALLILSWALLHLSQFDEFEECDLLELDQTTFKSHP